VREGLRAVVQEPNGTAHRSDLARFDAAGKTSTAQTTRTGDAHAWFAGYYPAGDPRYVIVVFTERGGSGSKAAAPLAAKILELLDEKRLHAKN